MSIGYQFFMFIQISFFRLHNLYILTGPNGFLISHLHKNKIRLCPYYGMDPPQKTDNNCTAQTLITRFMCYEVLFSWTFGTNQYIKRRAIAHIPLTLHTTSVSTQTHANVHIHNRAHTPKGRGGERAGGHGSRTARSSYSNDKV